VFYQSLNPFTEMRHWLQFEELEIDAVLELYQHRKAMLATLEKLVKRHKEDLIEAERL
jgi:hypothetical protein